MGPVSAAKAVEFVRAKKVVPIHYGTFPVLTGDPEVFKAKVGAAAEVIILKPGEKMSSEGADAFSLRAGPMAYLIDGNNLLGFLFPGWHRDPENKLKLVRRLIAFHRSKRVRIILVFDGAPVPDPDEMALPDERFTILHPERGELGRRDHRASSSSAPATSAT